MEDELQSALDDLNDALCKLESMGHKLTFTTIHMENTVIIGIGKLKTRERKITRLTYGERWES